jgi:hypothetical protein
VLSAIERYGLSRRHAAYAVAIFSTPEESVGYRRLRRLKLDHGKAGAEIAMRFFGGKIDFEVKPTLADPPDYHTPDVNQDAFYGR